MKYLKTIYKNNSAEAYAVENLNNDIENNIQIQIGKFAMMLNLKDIPNFLKVIQSAKKEICCANCENIIKTKIIKCETKYASIKIKTTPKLIIDIEEIILSIICNYQVDTLLKDINIKQ